MKTVKFNFAGKAWEVEANNSGEVSPGAPKELVELLKSAPRSGYNCKGVPIVKSDDGTNIYLGAAELRNPGETRHPCSGSGSGTSTSRPSAVPLAFAKEALGLKGLSEEAKKYFEGIVLEAEEAQKAKVDKIVKDMVAAGVPEDVAIDTVKKTLGL